MIHVFWEAFWWGVGFGIGYALIEELRTVLMRLVRAKETKP